MNKYYEELSKIITKGEVIRNAPMKEYTSFKAGGDAELLVIPGNEQELMEALKILRGSQIYIMGNGSNVLVKDGGYKGTIVKIDKGFSFVDVEGTTIHAGSGALLSTVARNAQENSLTGFEFASGIPGSLGGAVFMNAGAYGGEIKDVLKSIVTLDPISLEKKTFLVDDLNLGYRESILQSTGEIVLEIVLELKLGNKEEILDKMKELTSMRNRKQPVAFPSAGSFFKRPTGYFAGKLIQDANLKGLTVGGAQVSPLHAGFIINKGNATAREIVELMHLVQAAVMDDFGVKIEPEVRIIGED